MKKKMGRVRSPGKERMFLETRRYSQSVKVRIPALKVRGAKPGPLAVIMAAQHGRELNGIAAIERAFNRLDPAALAGDVVFLPVMNPLAVRMHQQDFPTEAGRYRPARLHVNMNMNRTWPGGGLFGDDTYASSTTEVVWNAFMKHADVGADLHGWSGLSLSLVWGCARDRALVRAFGLPEYLVHRKPTAPGTGMSEAAAQRAGIPFVVCELVPQNAICNLAVGQGERGIFNILKHAGLLKGELELPDVQYEFSDKHVETEMKTDAEGLVVSDFRKGDFIRKGQTAARVISLETLKTVCEFQAPHDAVLFNVGGVHWGEDIPESFVVYPGQIVGLLKKPDRIVCNR